MAKIEVEVPDTVDNLCSIECPLLRVINYHKCQWECALGIGDRFGQVVKPGVGCPQYKGDVG